MRSATQPRAPLSLLGHKNPARLCGETCELRASLLLAGGSGLQLRQPASAQGRCSSCPLCPGTPRNELPPPLQRAPVSLPLPGRTAPPRAPSRGLPGTRFAGGARGAPGAHVPRRQRASRGLKSSMSPPPLATLDRPEPPPSKRRSFRLSCNPR